MADKDGGGRRGKSTLPPLRFRDLDAPVYINIVPPSPLTQTQSLPDIKPRRAGSYTHAQTIKSSDPAFPQETGWNCPIMPRGSADFRRAMTLLREPEVTSRVPPVSTDSMYPYNSFLSIDAEDACSAQFGVTFPPYMKDVNQRLSASSGDLRYACAELTPPGSQSDMTSLPPIDLTASMVCTGSTSRSRPRRRIKSAPSVS